MDFNDTPEEAAFRKEVRAWLDANATRKSDDRQSFRARNDDPNLLKKYPNAITLQQIEEEDRFLGTVLGAAAGESLGAPHEGHLMLALLKSVVARHRFDQADVARRYLEWLEKGPKDVGNLTRA